jgi:hypothetical protein
MDSMMRIDQTLLIISYTRQSRIEEGESQLLSKAKLSTVLSCSRLRLFYSLGTTAEDSTQLGLVPLGLSVNTCLHYLSRSVLIYASILLLTCKSCWTRRHCHLYHVYFNLSFPYRKAS